MSSNMNEETFADTFGGPEAKAQAADPSTLDRIQAGFEDASRRIKDKLGDSWQDVRTLYQMAFDKNFQMDKKVKIVVIAALAYLVSPIDLLPRRVYGVLGFGDDVAVVLLALKYARPEIERYRRFKAGEGESTAQTSC